MDTTYRFKIILLVVLVVFVMVANGQTNKNQVFRTNSQPSSDTSSAFAYYQKAVELFTGKNYTQAIRYSEKSLKIAVDHELNALKADNLYLTAQAKEHTGSRESTIHYYIRAANVYEKLDDSFRLQTIYSCVGDIYYNVKAYEKATEYYNKAYVLLREISRDSLETVIMLENIGLCYFQQSNYQTAIDVFKQLETLCHTHHQRTLNYIRALRYLSELYDKTGEYENALDYNKKIYSIYTERNDSLNIARTLNNIAYNYVRLNQPDKAVSAFRHALDMGQETGFSKEEEANIMINIGIGYQNMNKIEQAVLHLQKATVILKSIEKYEKQAKVENIIALLYFGIEDYYNAEYFSSQSITTAKKSGDKAILKECYKTYSRILKAGNDYITALEYYERHLDLKDSLSFEERMENRKLAQKRYELEKSEKQLKLSIADEEMKDLLLKKRAQEIELLERKREMEKLERERLELERERLEKEIALTRKKHESELRQKRIRALENEKQIQELKLKKEEAEKKKQDQKITLLETQKEKQQLEIERQNEARKKILWMTGSLALIVILILVSLFTVRKKNMKLKKQKHEIEEKNKDLEHKNEEILTQKELIEEKNTAITDSIHYASRIQTAVLPPHDFIGDYFSDHFILFKPKDIVSGDFYWGAKKDGVQVIAAADCTGHGVPGAFMSMLGTAFLNEIMNASKKLIASEILNELRKNIIRSLRQSGEEGEAKDGMDIALCIVDNNRKTLQFSGANNPMYVIKNGELTIYKGDRMPIGIHQNVNLSFTNHELPLESGDVFYVFSDGFADQFGGDKGKKLKYKPFQQLLLNIHKEEMTVQKMKLERFFDQWKGDYEQIDDVLVIGMKI